MKNTSENLFELLKSITIILVMGFIVISLNSLNIYWLYSITNIKLSLILSVITILPISLLYLYLTFKYLKYEYSCYYGKEKQNIVTILVSLENQAYKIINKLKREKLSKKEILKNKEFEAIFTALKSIKNIYNKEEKDWSKNLKMKLNSPYYIETDNQKVPLKLQIYKNIFRKLRNSEIIQAYNFTAIIRKKKIGVKI